METTRIRKAQKEDLPAILSIYNEGIEDHIATLEENPKDLDYMTDWFEKREERYAVLVAETEGELVGWASLNPYSQRCAYSGVAELSVYVKRSHRGKGIGGSLLPALEAEAKARDFHKIVLFTFPSNSLGQGLYKKSGYREVGLFEQQGVLDGQFVDVLAMEKLL